MTEGLLAEVVCRQAVVKVALAGPPGGGGAVTPREIDRAVADHSQQPCRNCAALRAVARAAFPD